MVRYVAALVASGMTYTEAMSLTEDEMLVWYVALGEANGSEWDYDRMRWVEKK